MSETYTLYNQTVMDHFMNPRNMGDIKDADGVGEVGVLDVAHVARVHKVIHDRLVVESVGFAHTSFFQFFSSSFNPPRADR